MAFDFKKEYPAFYLPPGAPGVVDIPPMRFLALGGTGDPNAEDGAYSRGVAQLYAVAYTLRMSHRSPRTIAGFFEYVVPPLEGLWWQEGVRGMDYARKDTLQWVSMLRLPDFVTPEDVAWAVAEAGRKKRLDCTSVALWEYHEGLCVQCMHLGPYDDEPATIPAMDSFARAQGYALDITDARRHHEIYLSDPRRTAPEKRKTVLRHPIKRP